MRGSRCWRAVIIDIAVGSGVAGGDDQVPVRVPLVPRGDLAGVGGGVQVAVRGGGGLAPGLAGEHRPAAGRVGQGAAQRRAGSSRAPGLAVSGGGVAGVAAAAGLGAELFGQGGQDAGLVFGLGRDQAGAADGLQVQHGPQFGQDVQAVQAQVVGGPAGAEPGGQVPVAGR